MKNETYFTDDLHSLHKYWEDKERAKRFLKGGTRTNAVKFLIRRIEIDIHQGSWLDTGTGVGFVQTQVDSTVIPTLFVGLDFSGTMLRTQKSPYGERVIASTFNLPFREHAFKIVTNIFSLSDYPNIDLAFNELGRVVSRVGSFLHLDYAVGDEYWEKRIHLHNTPGKDGKLIIGNLNLRTLKQIAQWTPVGMRVVFQKYLEFEVKSESISASFDLPDTIKRKFVLTQFYKYKSVK